MLPKPYLNTDKSPIIKPMTKKKRKQVILEGIRIIREAKKIRENARKT